MPSLTELLNGVWYGKSPVRFVLWPVSAVYIALARLRRTGCPVVAGPDRVACVEALLEHERVDVVLSDDGLQHYRLARAFEIAVVDGARGMGNGLCLPAGPLREPPSRLQEVDAIVVNGSGWGHAGVFRAAAVVTHALRCHARPSA